MSIFDFFKPKKISVDFRDQPIRELYTPKQGITADNIGQHIMQLESSMGTDPNTAPDIKRSYMIPAANGNEKNRVIPYQVGYGGWAGITPEAMGQYHKSQFDRNAPAASSTKMGLPLMKGIDPAETQRLLMTRDGTQQLASRMFSNLKKNKNDWSPETLTNDYMDNWVGKGNKVSYTNDNRNRVLNYFKSI